MNRQPYPPCLELSNQDIICSRLAVEGMRRYSPPALWDLSVHDGLSLGKWCDTRHRDRQGNHLRYLNRRNGDWPALGSVDQNGLHLKSKSILAGFICAGLVYGALHLVAWNAEFPSRLEKLLWRSSGITLAVSGAILTIQYITPTDTSNLLSDMAAGMAVALIILLAITYVAARVYLVVECFINLKYLPEAAYGMPRWSHYFPHIT